MAPIQVKTTKEPTKTHNINIFLGFNFFVLILVLVCIGIKKLITEAISATTPPNLEGIERKIA